MSNDAMLDAARTGDGVAFERLVSPFRRELRAHCYRMSGSLSDADDLLQESLIRAWKGLPSFEGRSALRTWLYKVTTSACLDALDKRSARLLPFDAGPAHDPTKPLGPPRPEITWLEPCPDDVWVDAPPSPEAKYGARESVALAFLSMLQLLPPRQRAVLVLRDVLGWQATECAELLDMSVPAVNSALQRARETLEGQRAIEHAHTPPGDARTEDLLARYVRAWELADVPALVSLLHEDATLSMPPLSEWLQGAQIIGGALSAMVLPPGSSGRFRLVATHANGQPALAAYERDAATGEMRAAAMHVLTISGGKVASLTAFVDPSLFTRFGLPSRLNG